VNPKKTMISKNSKENSKETFTDNLDKTFALKKFLKKIS